MQGNDFVQRACLSVMARRGPRFGISISPQAKVGADWDSKSTTTVATRSTLSRPRFLRQQSDDAIVAVRYQKDRAGTLRAIHWRFSELGGALHRLCSIPADHILQPRRLRGAD